MTNPRPATPNLRRSCGNIGGSLNAADRIDTTVIRAQVTVLLCLRRYLSASASWVTSQVMSAM